MGRMKKVFAITLLILVVGLGAPATFADGNAESPGVTSSTSTTTPDGNAESPGITGSAESPGVVETVLIYLSPVI